MSATVYDEPNKLPAGILALLVHSLFFALLYFGFNWNRQATSQETMSVELWPSLPEDAVVTPPVSPKVEEVVPPPPQPEKIVVPDIAIPDKKKIPVKPVVAKPEKKKPVLKVVKAVKPKPDAPKRVEPDPEALRIAAEQTARAQAQQAEQAKLAEQAAAIGKIVDEYTAKIQDRIRRNVVMPPDVANNAHADFMVTLLPGGSVLKADLIKSSGDPAYDSAVERAILKSDPLPVPPDVQLFNRFRQLHLGFEPGKSTE